MGWSVCVAHTNKGGTPPFEEPGFVHCRLLLAGFSKCLIRPEEMSPLLSTLTQESLDLEQMQISSSQVVS